MEKNKKAKDLLLGYLKNIGDADKAIQLFAEDAVLESPYLSSLGMRWQWKGKDRIYDFLKDIPDTTAGFQFKDIQVHIETPDQVFAEYSAEVNFPGRPWLQSYMGRLVAANGKIMLLREALDITHIAKGVSANERRGDHEVIAGIDHIGMNVPDIGAATIFLQEAFGAAVIYESYGREQPPLQFEGTESDLNLALHTKLYACRMIKIGNGPNIELFEVHVDGQREAVRSSDLGLQHFAVYTDSMQVALRKFEAAGGKVLSEPNRLLFPLEAGEENYFCYGKMPWGTSVEFITYPEGMPYESRTQLRRWKAGK